MNCVQDTNLVATSDENKFAEHLKLIENAENKLREQYAETFKLSHNKLEEADRILSQSELDVKHSTAQQRSARTQIAL